MIKILSYQNFISEQYFQCDITPKRKVAFYEIELYHKGTGATFINSQKLPHKKNRLVFAKPGNIRFSTGSFECMAIHFTCSDLETRELLNSLPDFAELDAQKALQVSAIIQSEINNPPTILKGHQDVFDILSFVFSENTQPVNKSASISYYSNVMQAKDFIDSHYDQPITLGDIAGDTFLSPNFLRDRFTQIIGVSPHKYLNEIRLSKACKLLSTTTMPISEVADACGFNSQCYLNYVFKKEFKISPLHYRNTRESISRN